MLAADTGQLSETVPSGDAPDAVAPRFGDVNDDGVLTSLDALTLLNSVIDPIEFPSSDRMDLDENTQVDLIDYELVLSAINAPKLDALAMPADAGGVSGGTTIMSSGCDADEVFLDLLQSRLNELSAQIEGSTLPSEIEFPSSLIAATESSIAQVQARLDDCAAIEGREE